MAEKSTTKQVKGWALDERQSRNETGLRERLANSNSLWVVSFFLIVGVMLGVISFSIMAGKETVNKTESASPVGVYYDGDHQQFAASIVKIANSRSIKAQAKFLSAKDFRLVVPCDAAYDEILFLSRASANGISRRFGVRPVVWTYSEDITTSSVRLSAKTTWSEEKTAFVTVQQNE